MEHIDAAIINSIISTFSMIIGGIWAYAKLNAKVEQTHTRLKEIEAHIAKNEVEYTRIVEKLRDKMEDVEHNLSRIHVDMLKALAERSRN